MLETSNINTSRCGNPLHIFILCFHQYKLTLQITHLESVNLQALPPKAREMTHLFLGRIKIFQALAVPIFSETLAPQVARFTLRSSQEMISE